MHVRMLSRDVDIRKVLERIGVHPQGVEILTRKSECYRIYISGLSPVCANIIKQEMLAAGGDAAIPMDAITGRGGNCDVVLLGTEKTLRVFINKLKIQPFNLGELASQITQIYENYGRKDRLWNTGKHRINLIKPVVMGILNVTPDSFSDGGKYIEAERAIQHTRAMIEAGAEIIDIGAESTRPGSRRLSADEEIARLQGVLEHILDLNKPVSIDTYKPEVAKYAIEQGVEIVNDIFGLRKPGMVELIKEYGVGVCVMHMKGEPETMQNAPHYDDLMREICTFLHQQTAHAEHAGIEHDKIVIDPGIGFGKSVEHNYEILARLDEFLSLGYPVLVGTSRKSFIGRVLENAPPESQARLYGTIAMNMLALLKGASILRVHDVKENVDLIKLYEKVNI